MQFFALTKAETQIPDIFLNYFELQSLCLEWLSARNGPGQVGKGI